MRLFPFPLLFIVLFINSCKDADSGDEPEENGIPAPIILSYNMVNTYPHDTSAFTEGLAFYNGQLFESTGSPDQPANNGTWIANLDITSGKYEKKIDLGKSLFGEGITFLNDKLYQLTYKTEKGFVYDAKTFKKLKEFPYLGEGWGLTNDGTNLIMSAGTSNIYFVQPDSLKFLRMLGVQDDKGLVDNINELEYIDGYIYANKWLTPLILKIDPATGIVVGKMDLTRITNDIKSKYPAAEEMNGIAYDSVGKKIFITGKKWPFLYEIRL